MTDAYERALKIAEDAQRFGIKTGPIVFMAESAKKKVYCLPCDRFYERACPIHGD